MDVLELVRQLREALKDYAYDQPDEKAVRYPSLFPAWKAGETVAEGDRRYYEPKLYKVREGQGHTTQEGWEPDKTPALWVVIDVSHAGTTDDPIPASRGMEYEYGKYYSDPEDGNTYLCERTGEAAGGKIVLQYLPHELIGQYFTQA